MRPVHLRFRAARRLLFHTSDTEDAVLPKEEVISGEESYAQVESLVAPNSGCGLKPGGSTGTDDAGSTKRKPNGGATSKRSTEPSGSTRDGTSGGGATKKRPTPLAVRFSASEIKLVRTKAREAGCSTNSYVRASALGSDYRPPLDPELARALLALNRELNAQGNNLNQIARQLNTGIVLPGQSTMLDALASSINETLRRVRAALARDGKRAGA